MSFRSKDEMLPLVSSRKYRLYIQSKSFIIYSVLLIKSIFIRGVNTLSVAFLLKLISVRMRSGSPSWTWCWKLVICCIFLVASFIRATVCLTLTRCTSPSPPSRGTAGEICSSKYDPSLLSLCCEWIEKNHWWVNLTKNSWKKIQISSHQNQKKKKHFNLS